MAAVASAAVAIWAVSAAVAIWAVSLEQAAWAECTSAALLWAISAEVVWPILAVVLGGMADLPGMADLRGMETIGMPKTFIITIGSCATASITASLQSGSEDGGPAITTMGTAMVDAGGCTTVLWSPGVPIGGTATTPPPTITLTVGLS